MSLAISLGNRNGCLVVMKYLIIAIFSGMLSSVSQILLKKSTEKKRETVWKEYANIYVVSGYGIMFFCMLLTMIAYRGIPFKYGVVLESLVYFYIMVLSRIFFNEKITANKMIGNIMIVVGVMIFSLER